MNEYKMKRKETWTKEQRKFLTINYILYSNSELAKIMNKKFKTKRSRDSIKGELRRLNNKKNLN